MMSTQPYTHACCVRKRISPLLSKIAAVACELESCGPNLTSAVWPRVACPMRRRCCAESPMGVASNPVRRPGCASFSVARALCRWEAAAPLAGPQQGALPSGSLRSPSRPHCGHAPDLARERSVRWPARRAGAGALQCAEAESSDGVDAPLAVGAPGWGDRPGPPSGQQTRASAGHWRSLASTESAAERATIDTVRGQRPLYRVGHVHNPFTQSEA
jgi:hypothetical protein